MKETKCTICDKVIDLETDTSVIRTVIYPWKTKEVTERFHLKCYKIHTDSMKRVKQK